ncbi:type IVB secretion system protein IcmH/DotU [Collimonas humicola]|uniref:type IVB secretion system protein IcmH/DotU n=1 Tax=Collimonas humicola TaxID=2825886 RepID=UPI001B8CCFE0|nr:type IVB secretion system protein IcmH/DotU [Collimonas humicola]
MAKKKPAKRRDSFATTDGISTPTIAAQIAVIAKIEADDPDAIDLEIKNIVHAASETSQEIEKRLVAIKAARNPLKKAAQPLLHTLAKTYTAQFKGKVEVEAFRQLLKQEVINFKTLCTRANIKREHATVVSYSLCTALDEAANSTPWGGGTTPGEIGPWASDMLAKTFHGDIDGGKKVFLFIRRLAVQPHQHADVLEVLYLILSFGFEGEYNAMNHGRQRVEEIRQALYPLFMAGREPVPSALSPHWRGEPAGKLASLYSIPVWVTVAALSLVLLALFFWYKYRLTIMTNQIEGDMAVISQMMPQVEQPKTGEPTTVIEK